MRSPRSFTEYGFYYRYDTDTERGALNRLWDLVNARLNLLTPTKKPVGFGSDRDSRRTRIYDKPAATAAGGQHAVRRAGNGITRLPRLVELGEAKKTLWDRFAVTKLVT